MVKPRKRRERREWRGGAETDDLAGRPGLCVHGLFLEAPLRAWCLPPVLTERVLEMVLKTGAPDAIRDVVNAGRTCRAMLAAARTVLHSGVVWNVEVRRCQREIDDWELDDFELDHGEPVGSIVRETFTVAATCRTLAAANAKAAQVFVDQLVVGRTALFQQGRTATVTGALDRAFWIERPVYRKNVHGWPDEAYMAKGPPFDSRDMPQEARVRFDQLGYSTEQVEELGLDVITEMQVDEGRWWEGPGRDRVCVRVVRQVVEDDVPAFSAGAQLAAFKCEAPSLARNYFLSPSEEESEDPDSE